MNKYLFSLLGTLLLAGISLAQTPIIDAWKLNSTGTIAMYYTTSGSTTSTGLQANITKLCYTNDSVWVKTTGMPDLFGPWLNPGSPTDQDFTFRFPKNPSSATVKTEAPVVFAVGVLINGAPVFSNSNAQSYNSSTNTNASNGDGNWNGDAYYNEGVSLDTTFAGHVNQDGTYHSHATPFKLYKDYSTSVHSPIVGFAFDGYPIYGPFGYSDPLDASSAVKRIGSSYQLRTITTRTILPDGTTSSPAGPSVSTSFPLGMFLEDYEYVSGLGDLDEYNGRFCVTPEYPSGTYCYFVATDNSGNPKYPYYIGTAYYGVVDVENLNINSTVTMPASSLGCLPASSGVTVALSATSSSIAETGGTTTVTATLSGSTTSDVTVYLSFTGTASGSGVDYTASSSGITIPTGSTTGSLTISSVNDSQDETDETVIVTISSAVNATYTGTVSQTITIVDDDAPAAGAPTVTLNSPPTITEAVTTINVGVNLSATYTSTVTVTLSFSGTATYGTDYTVSSTVITIPAGAPGGSVTLTSVSDTKDESNETIIVDIASVANGTENSTQQKTITITDDDAAPNVTLTASPASISETGGSSTVTATLSAASGYDVTVNLGFTGTATSTTDYTTSASAITIAAGSTTGTITVSSVSDTKDENDETVIVDITTVTNATEATAQQTTITITDDDAAPNVTLSASPLTISETGGSSTVTATLASASGLDVTVNLGFTGTATSTTDYTASASAITITAGSTTGTITVSSVSDTKDENNETVIVDITTVTNATEATAQQTIITITDDDAAPNVTLSASPLTISETGGSSTVTATLASASGLDVTVNLGFTGTATSTTDYTTSASAITIAAGSTTGTITVSSVSDAKDENNETVIVDITTVTNATEATAQQTTISITDDDAAPNVTLSASPLTISETGGSSTVTATLASASGLDITVNLGFTGTATSTTDYTTSASAITIAAGSTTGTMTISSVNDLLDDDNESVLVDITSVTNGSELTEQQITLIIADDDEAEINLQDGSTSVSSGGNVDFGNVSIGSSSAKTFTIQNSGSIDLNVSSIIVEGTDASEYVISGSSIPLAITGGGSTTFTVTFTPICGVATSADIKISNADKNESTYIINLAGVPFENTAPVPDAANLSDITAECSVTLVAPTATDNCTGSIIATTTDPLTYDQQGSYIVTWTYTDASGNTASQTQNVIIADVTDPEIVCPQNVSVTGTGSTIVNYTAPVGTDNCLGSATSLTSGLGSGSLFPIGITNEVYTVTDSKGNMATCTVQVAVTQTTTGILGNISKKVTIYPNPSSDIVFIDIQEEIKEVAILNNHGEVLQKIENLVGQNKIDMTEFSSGIYFLIIKSETGVTTQKIDIQK